MAVLAVVGLAGLGAGVGAAAFGVSAISTGWVVGATVGQLLFPPSGPDVEREGPRLGDLTVTGSAYGGPIPIPYGTVRLAGNVIWSLPITEGETVDSEDAGGGTITTTTYAYSATFAVAFAQREAKRVLRIWADGKTIYDATSGADVGGIPDFRIYYGTEDQLPDSLIEADKGVGNVPAHRGLTYIVFDGLPLADFGNRIPSISAEIDFAGDGPAVTTLSVATPESGGSAVMTVDPNRNVLYYRTATTVYTISLDTLEVIREWPAQTVIGVDPETGNLFVSTTSEVRVINPITGAIVASESTGAAGAWSYLGAVSSTRYKAAPRVFWVARDSLNTHYRFFAMPTGLFEPELNDLGQADKPSGSYWPTWLAPGRSDTGVIWGAFRSSSEMRILKFRIDTEGDGVVWPSLAAPTVTPADLGGSAFDTTVQIGFLAYDPASQIVIGAQTVTGRGPVMFGWRETADIDGEIVWITDVLFLPNTAAARASEGDQYIDNGVLAWSDGGDFIRISTVTGAIDPAYNGVEGSFVLGQSGGAWLGSRNSGYYINSSGNGVTRWSLGGAGAWADLEKIVEDVCARVGYDVAADIDTLWISAIDVPGYVITRQMPAKEALRPLLTAFFWDFVERDYKLQAVLRGQSLAASLTSPDDFLPMDGGGGWVENRVQESELPVRVSVTYIDRDNDYQQNSQYAKRVRAPTPAALSDNEVNIVIPAVLEAGMARDIAEILLFEAWIARQTYDVRLPWSWIWLDGADPVGLNLEDGLSLRTRLATFRIGADFAIEATLIREGDFEYFASEVGGSTGDGLLRTTPPSGVLTHLFLLDMPLLADVDDTGGMISRLYVTGAGWSTPWPGATVYRSVDGSAWTNYLTLVSGVAWGYVTTPPGDPASFDRTDRENTIVVTMVNGASQLESVTELEMLNGANAAALIKANGQIEIVRFATVTEVADPQYELSILLRGRRGSETMGGGHAANGLFVLLNTSTLRSLTQALADLDVARLYRGVTTGAPFESVPNTPHTSEGRDLMPYAPVHIAGVLDGGDIDLTWVRRTRLGGELADGTGTVPLAEASEAYEVDILDGPGGSVLRTLSSGAPSVTYESADITTDFGSPPATLDIVVYQISDAVGRGFPGVAALEIS